MHVEWKIVTANPQVTRKSKEFAKMCCARNTSQQNWLAGVEAGPNLALRTAVSAVTLLVI